MTIYIALMAGAVFFGSNLFSIPMAGGHLSPYRALVLGAVLLAFFHMITNRKQLAWRAGLEANKLYFGFVAFFSLSLLSFLWVANRKAWFKSNVILLIALMAMTAIFFYINRYQDWKRVMDFIWICLVILLLLGLVEDMTGHYFQGDEAFTTLWGDRATQEKRVAFVSFSNGNDYAVLLSGFLCLSLARLFRPRGPASSLFTYAMMALALYLIYRSDSRLALISSVIVLVLALLLRFRWDLHFHWSSPWLLGLGFFGMIGYAAYPALENWVYIMMTPGVLSYISSEQIRFGLMQNGFLFLGKTMGLGVGTGNVEPWMALYRHFETDGKTNLHNWWGELLIANGVLGFMIYVGTYLLMSICLVRRRRLEKYRADANALLLFMINWVLVSSVSASNMLIEWHWVVFALIISFIKVTELEEWEERKRV